MKFKLDENLPAEAAALLREHGRDVHSVCDERLGGAADPAIAQAAQREQRILLTPDLDFADIRRYPPLSYPGIIVLRLARQHNASVLGMMPRLLEMLRTEPITRRLWIVDESRTRIREAR